MGGGYRDEAGGARARLVELRRELRDRRSALDVLETKKASEQALTPSENEELRSRRMMRIATGIVTGLCGGIFVMVATLDDASSRGIHLQLQTSTRLTIALIVFLVSAVWVGLSKTPAQGEDPFPKPHAASVTTARALEDAHQRIDALEADIGELEQMLGAERADGEGEAGEDAVSNERRV